MEARLSFDDLKGILPDAVWIGDETITVTGVSGLGESKAGDLAFAGDAKLAVAAITAGASVILVPADFAGTPRPGQLFGRVNNPSWAMALVCERIEAELRPRPEPGIHPSAVIDPRARIDASATIGPLCVIEEGVEIGPHVYLEAHVFVGRFTRIGAKTMIHANTSIYGYSVIGSRVLMQSGAVIGGDGFGFESSVQGHTKIAQVGRVVLEDDVEVGANSTIDRARLSETRIGRGTKIDNLVQVGHNSIIGRHCFLCAFVGISGTTTIGDFVVMAGQSATSGHLSIGDGAKVGGQSGVTKNIPAGALVTGTHAMAFQLERRTQVLIRRLPQMAKQLRELESYVNGG